MNFTDEKPLRIINSVAPIRICDNGGWTDTWFAEYGKIFNIGVYPYAEVQLEIYPANGRKNIVIHAENYGERYIPKQYKETNVWDRHPLLEAAIERMDVPDEFSIQVNIHSEAPVGASTGTSAAVSAALIGALDCLTPGRLTPHEVAYLAQSIETEMLQQQSGIQDQLCAVYGGINFIDMFQYPYCSVSQLHVSNEIWWELERRLLLIYLGKPHDSSKTHEAVIHHLEDVGPTAKQLIKLRQFAEPSRDAVYTGDFTKLGQCMVDNTEAQRELHPDLVGTQAEKIIAIAKEHGAIGWKVNGAGGDGGSVTLLCGDLSFTKRAMIREIEEENEMFKNIPIYLSRTGLRVWEE